MRQRIHAACLVSKTPLPMMLASHMGTNAVLATPRSDQLLNDLGRGTELVPLQPTLETQMKPLVHSFYTATPIIVAI